MNNSRQSLRIVTLLENNPYPRDVRVRPHMEALSAAGHQVTVICPRQKGQPWGEIINGVRIYRFPTLIAGKRAISYIIEFLWAGFAMTILMLWVWMLHGLDVLHIYNPPDILFFAGLLPKLAGKTIVFDLRDIAPELYQAKFEDYSGLLYRLLIWSERQMSQMSEQIIVVNESYRRIVAERDHVPPERISIVRQAPDINLVTPTEPDLTLRNRSETIIAYLGSMAKQDGIDHLLLALQYLERQFGRKNWLCILIGPAEDQQALKDLAVKLEISDRTWFNEYMPIEQWLPILSTADICVEPCPANPLNNISTMNKIMDYMALSKPTVAYDLHEHRFTAGNAALYAIPNDPVDLARQIARLIDNPDLRTLLGMTGRQRMEEMFAWEYQKQRLLTVYAKVMQQYNVIESKTAR